MLCYWMKKRLKVLTAEDALVLCRIFSANKPFYDASLMTVPKSLDFGLELPSIEKYAEFKVFPVFAYNINYFGSISGFETILKQFSVLDSNANELKFTKRMCKVIMNMADCMTRDHSAKLCFPILKAAVMYLSRFNEAELRQSRMEDINKFIQQLHRIFKKTSSSPQENSALTPVEEVELGVALKLCTLNSLERRLAGIGFLLSKLGRLANRWPTKEANTEALLFAELLKSSKFVNTVLGENMREEVLKRSGELLAFMYAWKAISGKDILNLWQYSTMKQSSIQTAVFQLIELLAVHLSNNDAFYLFKEIRQLPFSLWKESMIGILNALAINEYYRSKEQQRKNEEKNMTSQTDQPVISLLEEQKRGGELNDMELSEDIKEVKSNGYQLNQRTEETKDNPVVSSKETSKIQKLFQDDLLQLHSENTLQSSRASNRQSSENQTEHEALPFILEEESDKAMTESCNVLEFIWILSSEGALREGLALTVQNQLIELFLTLLNKFYQKKLLDYLFTTEEMLANDNSFIQCSKIYTKIVDSLSNDPEWKLKTKTEDLVQKLVMNIVRFKRITMQKGIELISAERAEDEECMDTQSSIEEKNAREADQFPVMQSQPILEDVKETETLKQITSDIEEDKQFNRENAKIVNLKQIKGLPISSILEEDKDIPEFEDTADERDIYCTLIIDEYLKLTYYQILEERLKLIKYLIIKGKLSLKKESIAVLWQALLLSNFSKKDVEMFFEFIYAIIRSESGLMLIAFQTFDVFFFDVLLKLDPREFSPLAFSCLKEMIITLNICYKQIAVKPSGFYEITNTKLIGLDVVWEVILQAHDLAVQKAASEFLQEILKRIASNLLQKQGTIIRKDFLMKCMDNINSGLEQLDSDKANLNSVADLDCIARVGRSLELLSSCINVFEKDKTNQHALDFNYDIYIKNSNGARSKLHVNSLMKTRDLLEKIRQEFKYKQDTGNLLFVTQGRLIAFSDLSIYEAGIKENMTINSSVLSQSDIGLDTQAPKETSLEELVANLQAIFFYHSKEVIECALKKAQGNSTQAADYLMDEALLNSFQTEIESAKLAKLISESKLSDMLANNNEHFMVLYKLLSRDNLELAEKAWNLLKTIPMNEEILEEMMGIRSMETNMAWEQIYTLEAPYKYLYNLRIIEYILQTKKKEEQYEWVTCFVMLEGLCELCNIVDQSEKFIKDETKPIPRVIIECIESSLRLIRHFMEASLIGLDNESYKEYLKAHSEPSNGDKSSKEETLVLKDEVGQMVLGIIQHQEYLNKLIKLMRSLSNVKGKVIAEGIELFITVLLSDLETGFSQLYKNEKYHDYLHMILIESEDETTKSILIKGLGEVFTVFNKLSNKNCGILPPDVIHLDLLTKMLPKPEEHFKYTDTYFVFLLNLLELYSGPNASLIIVSLEDMVGLLLQALNTKFKSNYTDEDKQLAGYLKLLSKLIETCKDAFSCFTKKLNFDLVSTLCCEVFGSSAAKLRKCAEKLTMRSAIYLLLALCKKLPKCREEILPHLVEFHEAQMKCAMKDVALDVDNKLPGSYVGLKNFGCTCYINSLLQQLYMMPEVRYRLLAIDPEKITHLGQDRVAANLQKIFASLQMSKQQYYFPTDFCKEFKDSHSRPINVCIQQDVDEFFNRLAEKLEAELKAIQLDRLLKDAMEIVLIQEITSLENDISFTSQKEDLCLALRLDIKGCRSIEEALDLFVKEEILDGDNKYHCEQYGRLIRASKKFIIKKLPKILMINLKRFEFNYVTMQKQKLNDYCEFPFELNLYKWCNDNEKNLNENPEKDYQYQLVGVLVHSGTAEGGHYYSYIKEREEKSPNYGKWFEFNDIRVDSFNPENLKREAYGKGSQVNHGGDSNAYFLVYQKVGDTVVEEKSANEKFRALIEQESEIITNTRIVSVLCKSSTWIVSIPNSLKSTLRLLCRML